MLGAWDRRPCHVNMRLAGHFIRRDSILDAVERFELVEAYPDDKYLPSYLVLGRTGGDAFRVLFAIDVETDKVQIVTAYRPDSAEWQDDLKTRAQAGQRIVSHDFDMGDWQPERVLRVRDDGREQVLDLWTVPARP